MIDGIHMVYQSPAPLPIFTKLGHDFVQDDPAELHKNEAGTSPAKKPGPFKATAHMEQWLRVLLVAN